MTGYLTLIPAFFGSLGFLFLFNVKYKHLIGGAFNGAAAWLVFLLIKDIGGSLFVSSLAGTIVAAALAEILARTRKAPSTLFYIGGIVPMVPGSNLYYMVEAFMNSDMDKAAEQGLALIWTILGIAVGAAAVLGIIWTIRKVKQDKVKK